MPLISSNWVVTGISYLNISLRLPHEFLSRLWLIVFKLISKLSKVLEKIMSGSLHTCSVILLYLGYEKYWHWAEVSKQILNPLWILLTSHAGRLHRDSRESRHFYKDEFYNRINSEELLVSLFIRMNNCCTFLSGAMTDKGSCWLFLSHSSSMRILKMWLIHCHQ